MSKRLIALGLIFSLFMATNFVAPKAQAVIGLIIKNKVTKIVGGIGLGAGAVTVGSVFVYAATTSSTSLGTALAAVGIAYIGLIAGGVGLLILDDNSVADVEFVPILRSKTNRFSADDVAIYNSELEELNAVRKTIQAEMPNDATVQDVNQRWAEYSDVLSPETVAIAEVVSAEFTEMLK